MKRNTRTTNNAKAFTLIELLVVISIIALLMGCLMPSLSAARQVAQKVTCMSNIRQMALITQMYTYDWDNYYPPAWDLSKSPSIAWCGSYYKVEGVKHLDTTKGPLWPYMQAKQVMHCKSFTPHKVKYEGSGHISGYGINWAFVAGDWNKDPGGMDGWASPARTTQITKPTETVLFADCAKWNNDIIEEEIFLYPRYKQNGDDYYARFHFRHRGKANVAFCDGHVGNITPFEPLQENDGNCSWVLNELMDRD